MPEIMRTVISILNSIFDMIILMIYLKCVLQHKKDNVNQFVYYAGFLVVCGIQYGISWFISSWVINILCSLVCIFILTFLYDNKMIIRIFAPISFQVFAMLSELLCYIIIQLIQREHLFTLYANGMSKLILFIIVLIISKLIRKNTAIITVKDYVFMLIMPLVSIVIIITITLQFKSEELNSGMAIYFSVAGLMIINFIVYCLLENIIEATEIREKQLQMEIQFDYQEKKYEQSSQSFKNISSIIHDTNKHLIYIRECIMESQNEEAICYINQAMDAVDKSYKRFNTGNLVIDALVSNAANVSINNRISFKSDIRIGNRKINMDRYDLCVILGNILDNSVESCQKILNFDDRHIFITIITDESEMIIYALNSISRNKSDFKTTTDKSEKARHGYGIKNIAAIAEKYGGTFVFEQKESSFESSVIVPLRDH